MSYYHQRPSVHALVEYLHAIANRDHSVGAKADMLIHLLSEEFIDRQSLELLYAGMSRVAMSMMQPRQAPPQMMREEAPACGAQSPQLNPDAITADGSIDWYEPDERFYALDKRSGAELSAVLEDLQVMQRYIRRGARPPTRLLFIGGAGTGKTAGALWIASQLGLPTALVRIDGIVSSLAGGKARKVRAAFEEAVTRQSVIVVDEFEAIAVPRADNSPNVPQWDKEATSALLQLLDSLPPEQIVIGATNVPEAIDPSVLRRMRTHVYFHPPDRDARASMLAQWWTSAPHEGAAKRKLLDLSEGHSGDILERAAESANRAAARRSEDAKISVADVETAMASILATADHIAGKRPEAKGGSDAGA